ncbi:MAG: PH domain-containing protein [Clostridium sp.]|jgi:hypothetical protein|nr:PH domain-containing protein [Clostridium sp.]
MEEHEALIPEQQHDGMAFSDYDVEDEGELLWSDYKHSFFLFIPDLLHKYWIQNGRVYVSRFEFYQKRRAFGKKGARGESEFIFYPHLARDSVWLFRVQDSRVMQGFWGRVFDRGTVTIISHDKTQKELDLVNIKHPLEFCNWLDNLVEYERWKHKVKVNEFVSD